MATNPFNIVPAKKTSPFNIPPAKPSVAGILDRALTGGFVSKTLSVADRFAKLSPEEKKKLLETGSDIQTTAPLKPEVLQKNIELKEATQKAAAKKFFDFEKSPLSISAAPTELIEAQKSPEAAAAYEKEQTRRRLQYVRQNEGYFPAVGEALKQYGQAKVEAMQPVLELADTAANKVEEQGRPILGGAVRGAKGLYQSSVGATGEAARQLGEGNVGGAAFTYGLGKLMNSSPTGMAWTAVMEQKPVKEYVQPVLDAWNNELDTFFADQKNNPFSPIGSVLKESGKLLPYLLFDKVSRIPFKSKKTITLQDGKTFEVPTDRKWYAEAKKSVFNDILQLADDPAKFFKEKQFGLSIKAVGDEAEKGKMTSLKDMRTKLPRAGIEKPAPLPDYTTRLLDMLGDRKTVSRQFINDLTNRPELRQAERDLIRSKLSEFQGDTVSVPDFAAAVRGDLLTLDTKLNSKGGEGKYENIALPDELRGDVENYYENIYQSPIKTTAGNVHFDASEAPNYFAHTRIEDLPNNTRRVIEVQSDLFQKGRLEKEGRDVEDARYFVERGKRGEYGGEPESVLTEAIKRQKELTRLEPYRNSWYERVIREEVKQASKDGKAKVQFPTGETAMKIEGLGDNTSWHVTTDNGRTSRRVGIGELEVGKEIVQGRTNVNGFGLENEWVITDVLGDGKFKAVPKRFLDLQLKNWDIKESIDVDGATVWLAKNRVTGTVTKVGYTQATKERALKYLQENRIGKDKSLEELNKDHGEEFDVSGKVDTNNPIYKYYEKDVQKFLKREYPDMKRVKDSQGVEWFEVDTTPKPGQLSYGEKPVFAFKEKPREGGISEEARARAAMNSKETQPAQSRNLEILEPNRPNQSPEALLLEEKNRAEINSTSSLEGVPFSTLNEPSSTSRLPSQAYERFNDLGLVENLSPKSLLSQQQAQVPDIFSREDMPMFLQKTDKSQLSADQISAVTKQLKVPSSGIIPQLSEMQIERTNSSLHTKVNLLDWFRTPDRVLEKIGLGKEGTKLKKSYNMYLDALPHEINKITSWWERVKEYPDASKKIFQYLDGQEVGLNPKEAKVAVEIKDYLAKWADKLGLPPSNRIANYITHIFDEDFIKKEFDQDLAKLIAEKIPGSVYDPFLQQRLGKLGYIEDAFLALDAYTKRATRKYYMDPALKSLKEAADPLDLDSFRYVQSLAERVNLRPTQIDNYLDNLIKQSFIGYKFGARPTARVSRFLRQTVYRGTLGLNFGSAVRNLSQGANTYAMLGEKYTVLGYMKAIREMVTRGTELERAGVLRDNIIQDRQLSAVKGTLEKLDKGLWIFFNATEKINRGAAYFGAKARAIKRGLSELEATEAGVEAARKTQFSFGSVDTPVALQSDLVKTFTQFQSYNIKQAEFLSEMIRNKQFAGLVRWTSANLLFMATIGSLFGYDLKDMIPFSGVLTGETKLGATPPIQLGSEIMGALMDSPDDYGKPRTAKRKLIDVLTKLKPFVPAGIQLSKTADTVKALLNNGQVKSSSGKTTNFVIRNKSLPNIAKGLLFGQYATEEGQKYLNRNKRTKSLFNIPSASGNNPFKLQSGNTSGNPFVLPKAR